MSSIFAKKTDRAFKQVVLMIAAILVLASLAFIEIYQKSSLYLNVLMHRIAAACGCADMAQFFATHRTIYGVLMVLGSGLFIFALYSLFRLIKLSFLTRKYIAYYLFFKKSRHSVKLESALKASGIESKKVIEIDYNEAVVFCFGFLSPKICISNTLVGMLSKNELKVVLMHERRHMISYEPLKIFIAKYFEGIFFFLPGIKPSVKKYFMLSELAADEKASGSMKERSHLASAILKISEQEEYGVSLSFFNPAVKERVNRLSDGAYAPEFKFLDKSLITGSFGLIIAALALVFVFSNNTKAFQAHNNSGCITPTGVQSDLACPVNIEPQKIIFGSRVDSFNMDNMQGIDLHENCDAK